VLGLIIRWHVFAVLVSMPFLLIWRERFRNSLREPSRVHTTADRLGVALFVLLFSFCALTVTLIIAGSSAKP
jgi:hypothetical protein